jgi:hypothetical protein
MLQKSAIILCLTLPLAAQTPWSGYGHDAQHSGLSSVKSQRLDTIKWSTPVDLVLANTPGTLLVHYGSPIVTLANTVLIPVRTSSSDTFRIDARDGATGALKYTLNTDYSPPPHNWVPSYGPVLASGTRVYYAGAGGTVYYRDQPDSASGASGQIAFYGNALYTANQSTFNSNVKISTPLVAGADGAIYFGFQALGTNPANLVSGIARIGSNGVGSWVSATTASGGDASITTVPLSCTPALSNDGLTLYFAVSSGGSSGGYLVSVNSSSLQPMAHVRLIDPETAQDAKVLDVSSASPTVGPDGDVYYGVFETSCCSNHDRGWLLHFNGSLSQTKTPGAFGWDTTASVVPANLVSSYHGGSTYLLLTKYNNYAGSQGGDGHNKVAVLDPNASMTDPVTAVSVMQEVITVLGPTLDPPGNPNGTVREWCINSAAIDPITKSAIINSEDGVVYRWDFGTNTLSEQRRLTGGVGEAYTPTIIGLDGTVYAINDAVLFAVGELNPLQFVPVTPCRIMDTRGAAGAFGAPMLAGGATRTIPIQSSTCGIPASAKAYSLNATVIPRAGTLGYVTLFPTGQSQPGVSTLNSPDGSVIANAAIVPAGSGGSIDVFALQNTDFVLDINGYFTTPGVNTLAFYPLTPCRAVDTRNTAGTFGGPFITGNASRAFPLKTSTCGVPASAQAYSLNITVSPHGFLGFLTAWSTGQSQPTASTLNSLDGTVLANAAIVPAGSPNGSVSFFASNDTDVIVDVNGYFAAPAAGGLNFYAVNPCRAVDTRNATGPLGGPIMNANTSRTFALPTSSCGLPDTAGAYSLNVTVQPSGFLGFATLWPAGQSQPAVSTLNDPKGIVTANAALVPAGTSGAVNVYVLNNTHVIIDINGWFGQ